MTRPCGGDEGPPDCAGRTAERLGNSNDCGRSPRGQALERDRLGPDPAAVRREVCPIVDEALHELKSTWERDERPGWPGELVHPSKRPLALRWPSRRIPCRLGCQPIMRS
jgi:hypothetical protein